MGVRWDEGDVYGRQEQGEAGALQAMHRVPIPGSYPLQGPDDAFYGPETWEINITHLKADDGSIALVRSSIGGKEMRGVR
jgi:hypothetical protein